MEQMLADLKIAIYEDGEVSDAEVEMLANVVRRYGATDVVVKLFLDINNVLSGEEMPDSFRSLFVEVVGGFVLGESGSVGDDKWLWLQANLLKDQSVDILEGELLRHIAAKAVVMPAAMAAFIANFGGLRP